MYEDGSSYTHYGSGSSITQQGSEYTTTIYKYSQYGTSRTVSLDATTVFKKGSSVNKIGSSITGYNRGDPVKVKAAIGNAISGLFVRNSDGDTSVNLRGTEVKNLYERDQASDKTIKPINEESLPSQPYYKDTSKDVQQRIATGQLTFTPATISTQRLTVLTT